MTAPRALRCIFSGQLPPVLNMGLDEALMRIPGPPTLRLYQWSPPGLSLGYFQRSGDFAGTPGPHVLVRRITGGGAIYHQGDLTFALTIDLELVPTPIQESYRMLHRAIGRALRRLDVDVRCDGSSATRRHSSRPTEPWCLADGGPHDVLDSSGRKMVGSAQRRIRAARPRMLHHGSIPIRRPPAVPQCGAVADHTGAAPVLQALGRGLADEIAAALGLTPETGELTAAELRLARELARTRYQTPAFTHRR